MRNLRGTYVHRGDAARKRRRIRQAALRRRIYLGDDAVVKSRKTATANAAPAVTGSRSLFRDRRGPEAARRARIGEGRVDSGQGSLRARREDHAVFDEVRDYGGTRGKVFDASLREGIDPELAFRLVRLESEFNPRAVSKVGALGLTQLMPSTAKMLDKKVVSREQLFNPQTNLRVGFRYLRSLLDMYKGNVNLALLAYNRGEDAVWRDVRAGVNPGNGYDRWVMTDYKGKGLMQ